MQNNPNLNPKSLFAVGSEVEVTSDGNGFGNSWYRAKIIKPPNPTGNNEQFWIQYDNLVEEDDHSQLLKEQVHASFIRPLPPDNVYKRNKNPFELNDVVEAFHEDGWWVGVVKEVRELNKYLVAFPSQDQIYFRKRKLRIHLDWINGKWVHPSTKVSVHDTGSASTQKKKRGRPSNISIEFLNLPKEDDHTPPRAKEKDRIAEQVISNINTTKRRGRPSKKDPPSLNLLKAGEDLARDEGPRNEIKIDHEAANADEPMGVVGNSPALSEPISTSEKGWPFSMTSSMWSTIDSLKIFQKMSIMPHFSPLHKYDVNMREKIAIDMMIKFAYEAERILTLSPSKLENPDMINDILDNLKDLEPHGFDTIPLEEYLRKLSPEVHKERELKEKLEKVESKIIKCQEERNAAETEMKIKDQELAWLEAEKSVISNEIRSLEVDSQKKMSKYSFCRDG